MRNIFQGNDLLSGVTTEGPTNSFSLGRPVLLSDILLIPSVHSFPESHPSQASCFLPVAALSGSPPTVPPSLSTASSTCLRRVHTGLRAGASPTFQKELLPHVQKELLPHVQVGRRLPYFPSSHYSGAHTQKSPAETLPFARNTNDSQGSEWSLR